MADDVEKSNIDAARRAGLWLLAIAIICALASCAIDRFGHELCHRGLPLVSLTLGAPIVGAMAGLAALSRRSRAWLVAIKVIATAVNAWQLVSAVIVMAGVGIAACG